MATQRSAQNPYRWSNGSWHSRPENTGAGAPKPVAAPPKPKTYVTTPSGAIGTGTAAAMAGLAKSPGAGPAQNPPGFAPRVPGQFAPPDPIYEGQVQGYRNQRTDTMADLAASRQTGLAGYGYTEDTATGALAFDPNNPFSKAALLKKSYDASRRRTGNVMAAGGNLYAGSYQSAQDVVNRGELQSQDELQKSLADFLARNTAGESTARTTYETNVADAEAARVGRVDTNPLYEPTNERTQPKAPKPKVVKPPVVPKKTTPKSAANHPPGLPYKWKNGTWHSRPQR